MEIERGKALLEELRGSVESMKAVYDSTQSPLTDDDTSLQIFCQALENALRHGQKDRSSLFGGTKDYWNFFKAGLSENRTFHDLVFSVQNQADLKTPVGQGRAFIRRCLVEGCLGDAIQFCTGGKSNRFRENYRQDAILREGSLVSILLDIVYGLSEMHFTLGLVDLSLDQSWPTFAKKVFVGRTPPRNRRSSKPRKAKAALIADSESDCDTPLNDSPASGFIPRTRKEGKPEETPEEKAAAADTSQTPPPVVASDPAGGEAPAVPDHGEPTEGDGVLQEGEGATARKDSFLEDEGLAVAELLAVTAETLTPSGSAAVEDADKADSTVGMVSPPQDPGIAVKEESPTCPSAPNGTLAVDDNRLVSLLQTWLVSPGSSAQSQSLSEQLISLRSAVAECRQQLVDEVTQRQDITVGELSAERDLLSQQCADFKSELSRKEEHATTLLRSLDEMKKAHCREVGEMLEKYQHLEFESNESVTKAESALDDVQERLLASEAIVQKLEEEKKQIQSEIEGVSSQQLEMDALQLQVRSHASQVERYNQELTSLRETSRREAEEWRERMASTERHHQQQLAAAKQRSDDLGSQLKESSRQLSLLANRDQVNGVVQDTPVRSGRSASVSDDTDVIKKIQFQLSAQAMQLQHANEELSAKKRELEVLQYEVLHSKQQQSDTEAKMKETSEAKENLRLESVSFSEEIRLLTETSSILKSEIAALESQLVASNKERDMERVANLKLNAQVEQHHIAIAAREAQIMELRTEVELVKSQLLTVTRQKADLVNRRATLEDKLSNLAPKQWIDDDQVDNCMMCEVAFTLFNRRHHCRNCGRVFCATCCDHFFQLSASSKPSRVCVPCYERLARPDISHIPSPENFVIVTEGSQHCVSVPPVRERRDSDESLAQRTAGGKIVLGDSGDEDEDKVSDVGAANMSYEAVAGDSLPGSLPRQFEASGESVKRAASQQSLRSLHSRAGTESPSTLESSIAYTSHTSGSTKSLSRTGSKSSVRPKKFTDPQPQVLEMLELPIKPGCYHTIPVLIDQPGARISWRFQTEPKGVAFGIALKSSDMEEEAATTLVPLRRTGSHKQMVSGDWVSQQPGIYTLQFDNTSSTVTSCRISYRVVITPAD